MYTLLISTTVILLLNLGCEKYKGLTRDSGVFLIPMLLPEEFYRRTIVGPVTYVCVGVCLMFALPLT